MSKLNLHARPYVDFDPSNKQHREWYREYVVHNTWGKCPVRFCQSDGPDSIYAIRDKLIEYYINQEFDMYTLSV